MAASARYQRQGVVIVQTAVMSAVLLGFVALTVDIGRAVAVRAEAQRAADAAALAGASGLATDGILTQNDTDVAEAVRSRALAIARKNRIFNDETHIAEQDVEFGRIDDPWNLHSPFVPSHPAVANAVRVTVRRSAGAPDGPIPTAFAGVLGKNWVNVEASATAIVDRRMAGFRPPPNGEGILIPLTIQQQRYLDELENGADTYGFEDGAVRFTGDGIREIRLYPDKQGGSNGKSKGNNNSNGGAGSGNFGILNIGHANNGVPEIEAQILNGVTPENLTAAIGMPEIRFVDDSGNPITHQIVGDPGVKAGIKDALEQRIGDVVGFFIHTTVASHGANAQFTVVGIRFGRVLAVDLSGSANGDKGLVLQPVAYEGSSVITASNAPSAGAYVSRIRLVR